MVKSNSSAIHCTTIIPKYLIYAILFSDVFVCLASFRTDCVFVLDMQRCSGCGQGRTDGQQTEFDLCVLNQHYVCCSY